jgi:hypothetical protein
MNKFVLMIFSVSIFFLCVGAMVKQIGSDFFTENPHLVGLPRIETGIGEEETTDFPESSEVKDKPKMRILIQRKKIEEPGKDFHIEMRSHFPPERIIEFQGRDFSKSLIPKAEIPSVSEEELNIFPGK